jgi:hypothetical protein
MRQKEKRGERKMKRRRRKQGRGGERRRNRTKGVKIKGNEIFTSKSVGSWGSDMRKLDRNYHFQIYYQIRHSRFTYFKTDISQ